MERADQAPAGQTPPPQPARERPQRSGQPGGLAYRLAAAGLGVLIIGVALLIFLQLPPPGGDAQPVGPPKGKGNELFRGWPDKLDVALVLSGQQYGYIQPCGCSEPQYGGLTRRYNFLQTL